MHRARPRPRGRRLAAGITGNPPLAPFSLESWTRCWWELGAPLRVEDWVLRGLSADGVHGCYWRGCALCQVCAAGLLAGWLHLGWGSSGRREHRQGPAASSPCYSRACGRMHESSGTQIWLILLCGPIRCVRVDGTTGCGSREISCIRIRILGIGHGVPNWPLDWLLSGYSINRLELIV